MTLFPSTRQLVQMIRDLPGGSNLLDQEIKMNIDRTLCMMVSQCQTLGYGEALNKGLQDAMDDLQSRQMNDQGRKTRPRVI